MVFTIKIEDYFCEGYFVLKMFLVHQKNIIKSFVAIGHQKKIIEKIMESNSSIFRVWFNAGIVSFVPTLVERPKWHSSNSVIQVGDVVLFFEVRKGILMSVMSGASVSGRVGAQPLWS